MKNAELFQKLQALVRQERKISVEILELLAQTEQRKAYSELGYDGLFSFCVKELRYSESQAYRRIQAMRALQRVPELKAQIETGNMTVTTVSQVQTYLNEEKKKGAELPQEEIIATFDRFNGQSAKEVEAGILELQGKTRYPTLEIDLSPDLEAQWDRVRNLSAHKTQGDPGRILQMLMDDWLKRNEPVRECNERTTAEAAPDLATSRRTSSFSTKPEPRARSARTIPKAIQRAVWVRDRGQCVRCESKYALQFDHIQPIAKGGLSIEDNLRLLCRSCNLAAGIRIFGTRTLRRENRHSA